MSGKRSRTTFPKATGTSALDELREQFEPYRIWSSDQVYAKIDAFEKEHPGLVDLGVCAGCGKPFKAGDDWIESGYVEGRYHNGDCYVWAEDEAQRQ